MKSSLAINGGKKLIKKLNFKKSNYIGKRNISCAKSS